MKRIISKCCILFLLIPLVISTWHFTNHKICHPNHPFLTTLPFTGFKVTRQYKISGIILPISMHFLTLSHCDHGQVDYQKTIRIESLGHVDWDKPFCMLKPKLGEMLTLPSYDIIGNPEFKQEEDLESYLDVKSFMKQKYKKLNNLVRKKIDLKLERKTNGKSLEYTGKNKYYHNQDLLSRDPQSSLEWESRNLVCYKMARRKKYAKRRISFYMPHTFVGGLFECYVPPNIKKQIFQEFTSLDLLAHLFDFKCDPQLSRPIFPLIAEDSTSQWFENKLYNIFNPGIVQTIPYLTTLTPLNLRFSSLETSDMYKDTWATKIEVNEDYVYTEADIHLVSQAVAKLADLLNKLISPIDFNGVVKSYNKANERENPESGPKFPEEFDSILKTLPFEEKLNFWFSYLDDKLTKKYLSEIEKLWDKLV